SILEDSAATGIYTLSLHDALPISEGVPGEKGRRPPETLDEGRVRRDTRDEDRRLRIRRQPKRVLRPLEAELRELFAQRRVGPLRSEEHTSELQSRENLVCRLLLEK